MNIPAVEYVPTGHAVQTRPEPYHPLWQVQMVVSEVEFALQLRVLMAWGPQALHGLQAEAVLAPVAVENVPAGHAVQTRPEPYHPAWQVQIVVSEVEFALQLRVLMAWGPQALHGLQAEAVLAPVALENVPAGHAVQTRPEPYHPAWQVQIVVSEVEFA